MTPPKEGAGRNHQRQTCLSYPHTHTAEGTHEVLIVRWSPERKVGLVMVLSYLAPHL